MASDDIPPEWMPALRWVLAGVALFVFFLLAAEALGDGKLAKGAVFVALFLVAFLLAVKWGAIERYVAIHSGNKTATHSELCVSVEIAQPPWGKMLELQEGAGHDYLMIILDGAVVTNQGGSPLSLMFDLIGQLKNGHPYIIPEHGIWDRVFKTPESIHSFLRGPLSLAPHESATGDLGFICYPKAPHDSDVDMFSLRLRITDRIAEKSREFPLDELFPKWVQANVLVKEPAP